MILVQGNFPKRIGESSQIAQRTEGIEDSKGKRRLQRFAESMSQIGVKTPIVLSNKASLLSSDQ
jgi:hypothetical protein